MTINVDQKFYFRWQQVGKTDAAFDAAQTLNPDAFESAAGKIRRKDVIVPLTIPTLSELAELADDDIAKVYAQDLVRSRIAEFVKKTYIDDYLVVGDHSLAYIGKLWAEAQDSRGSNNDAERVGLNDADFAAAQAYFSKYLAKVSPKFAASCTEVIVKRCTKLAVAKTLSAFNCSAKSLEAFANRLLSAVETATAEAEAEAVKSDENAVVTDYSGIIESLIFCAERVSKLHAAALAAESLDSDI